MAGAVAGSALPDDAARLIAIRVPGNTVVADGIARIWPIGTAL